MWSSLLLLLLACRRDPPPVDHADEPDLDFFETPNERKDEELPLVMAVHGLSDRAESHLALMKRCRLEVRVVAPQGFLPYGRGFGWFEVTFPNREPQFDPSDLDVAVERLATLLRAMAAERPTRGKPVMVGFSQGGMLSFLMAVRHPELVAGVVPVAGFLPEALRPTRPAPPDAPPVHALHGEEDPLIPVRDGQATVDALAAQGWPATMRSFPEVEHQLSRPVHEALCDEIAAMTGAERRGPPGPD